MDKAEMARFFGRDDYMVASDTSLIAWLRAQARDYTAELHRRAELPRHEDIDMEMHRMMDRVQLAGKISGLKYVIAILENREDTRAGRERRHKYVAL